MSFFNFLRGFLGKPTDYSESNHNRYSENDYEDGINEFRNPIWNLDDDDDDDDDFRRPRNRFSFHIDSNPLEIHRFFERQIDHILRSFGHFGLDNFGEGMMSLEPPHLGTEGVHPEFHAPTGNLRDQYLKPGYERGPSKSESGKKVDCDLDDSVSVGEVSKMLQEKPSNELQAEKAFPFGILQPNVFGLSPHASQSFGRSMTSKTVTRPNGGVEQQKTVRDSAGNEEVTVTRSLGHQSYTVTTRIDSQGKQERIENFVNMGEDDLKDFEKKWGSKL